MSAHSIVTVVDGRVSYPAIDHQAWSDRIERWNAMSRDRRREQLAAADRCRRLGHDLRLSPVGPWCRCCCQYFRGEGE